MINLMFDKNAGLQGSIRAEIEPDPMGEDFPYVLPLKFVVRNCISRNIHWSCEIWPGMWADYPWDVTDSVYEIRDGNDILLTSLEWDTLLHGDLAYQIFWSWARKNQGSRGLAIGTHNGTSGEWVRPCREKILSAVLVEASEGAFIELEEFWSAFENVTLFNKLISTDGKNYSFYESGFSETNSTIKEHVQRHINSTDFTETTKPSITLNDLIISYGMKKKCKWLHLDVEGMDSDLILSLDSSKIDLPQIIVWETRHSTEEKFQEVSLFLKNNGYTLSPRGRMNTVALKKKIL